MTRLKLGSKSVISVALAVLLLFSGLAWQRAAAQVAPRPADLPPAQPAALSSTLSYYFISGNTFTPALGSSSYARQVNGCVNQTPAVGRLSAPVHLPQASQVVSITLFTYDSVPTATTFSTAYFGTNDGQGNAADVFGLSADSDPGVMGYQHHQNLTANPTAIDNQTYSYQVDWRKVIPFGESDSPSLSLCGVRLSYYAPVGATFLPVIER